ncbi:MAG: hypothetical protein ABH830_03455 [Patescibacteria group bacterium]
MNQKIYFAVREMGDVYALTTIIEYCIEANIAIEWHIVPFSVNSDLSLCQFTDIIGKYRNAKIEDAPRDEQTLKCVNIFGFSTDMKHQLEKIIQPVISVYDINVARRDIVNVAQVNKKKPWIVVGNIKLKSPIEDFQYPILQKLSLLPYKVILVPRHPLTTEEAQKINLPVNLTLDNSMGKLVQLYAQADLTIMGKIFSVDRFEFDDGDHNPLEATISSNTICIRSKISDAYKEFYELSGLMHCFNNHLDSFEVIDKLIYDPSLKKKLQWRKKWIEKNRQTNLQQAIKKLGIYTKYIIKREYSTA